jgi:integrase/recombinase XerD
MGVLLSRYLSWMRVQNYSERTVENAEVYLGYFIEWCQIRGIHHAAEVTKPILEGYQRHLYHHRKKNGRALSFRTQHGRLVPVRGFFKWLTKSNYLLYNPASELELPRLERRLPQHVLTVEEAERVLMVPDITDILGLRDRAILELLYSTGMRRMELIGLSVYDLDAERGTVLIRQGKGRKDRMVPVGERALIWCQKYIDESRRHLVVAAVESGTLFLTNTGEVFTPTRLTQLARGYVDRADLGKRGACHLFRHTMATLMLENGADIRFIQQMLGHANLNTTEIYTSVSIRKLQQIHAATHPAARAAKPVPAAVAASPEAGAALDQVLAEDGVEPDP